MSTATQRNRDFLRKCRLHVAKLRAEGKHFTLASVARDVLAMPAPSYYADYYRANMILRRALTHGGLDKGTYRKSRMWQDMYDDLLELMRRYPKRTFHDIVLDLCTGGVGHPRFYMTPRLAREVLRKNVIINEVFWR